jgi:hypothetical protein
MRAYGDELVSAAVCAEDAIELDAALALVPSVGYAEPQPEWQRADWRELERDDQALKANAEAGGTVMVTLERVARGTAELAGLSDPTRPEAIDLLVSLVQTIDDVMRGSRRAFLGAGLQMFGWPSDPDERLMDHLIAAGDLGLFDPPGQPPRRVERQDGRQTGSDDDDRGHMVLAVECSGDGSAVARAQRIYSAQPAPSRPPTAPEQFLFDWGELLGAIIDQITDEPFSRGYLEHLG